MKKLFSLLVCLELILSPLAPSLTVFSNVARADDCQAGFVWDSNLNRCLTSQETATVMNATANCGQDVECYKQNAIDALQKAEANGDAPERVNDKGGLMSSVGNIAAIAVPVTIAAGGMSNLTTSCSSISFWAMVGGAAALVVGDTLANMQHKSRLKKIKKDWGKIVNPEEANGDKDKERTISMEAQSQAFEMLARAEESLAKAAKMKKTFFTIATLAYLASTAMAIVEIVSPAKANSFCKSNEKPAGAAPPAPAAPAVPEVPTNDALTAPLERTSIDSIYNHYVYNSNPYSFSNTQFIYNLSQAEDFVSFLVNQQATRETNSSPSIDYYETVKTALGDLQSIDQDSFKVFKEFSTTVLLNLVPVSNSYAADEVNTNAAKTYKEIEAKGGNPLLTIGIGAAAGYALGKFAGLGKFMADPKGRAAFSGLMTIWTKTMADHAGKQAKASTKRAELLRKMKSDFASASGAIYACTSEARNDPGQPSCYCYTAEGSRNSNRGSSSVCQKLWSGQDLTPGVYTASNNTESSKICINNQNQADSTCACKSTNTCLKVGASGITGLNPGTFSMLSQSLDPLNKVASGSVDAANISSAALDNQAARMNDLVKKMENSKNKGLADYQKNKDKLQKGIQTALNKAGSGMPSSAMLGGGSSGFGFPSNAKQAASMLEKDLEEAQIGKIGGGPDSAVPGGDSNGGPGLEFGLTADQLANQETQIADLMKKDLDYGQNDINNSSNTNIFELLSNRYQRSGMRRLFDEKGVTKPDAPNKNDITQ